MVKCVFCGKDLPGVTCDVPGQKDWACYACSQIDDAQYCVRGDNVVYAHPNAGSRSAQLMAARHLTPGNTYTVDAVAIHHHSSYLKIQDLPPIWFDTRLFDRVNND